MFALRLNLDKSTLTGIHNQDRHLNELVEIAGCLVSGWPLTYLGVSLGGNLRLESFWDPVIVRISKMLYTWKRAYFSLGGRITLVQACLSSMPL